MSTTKEFVIIDINTGTVVDGPYKRGKIKRRYQSLIRGSTTARGTYHILESSSVGTGKTSVIKKEVQKEPIKIKKKKSEQEVQEEQMAHLMEPDKWQFRSSTYSREDAANELVERLSLTDYEIVKVSKGWYVNYNDTD